MSFPSEEQKKVIDGILECVKNKKDCTLEGFAGTGKSSIVGVLIEALEEMEIKYQLTATTNRACRSLEEAIYETSERYVHARTIHSYFDLKPTPDGLERREKEFHDFQYFKGVIFIDESSMIGSILFDFCMESQRMNSNIIFIFVGDTAQLPPIKEKIAKCFVFDIVHFYLTEYHRQKDGNPVGPIANEYRLAQEGEKLIERFEDDFNSNGEGVYLLTRKEYDQAAYDSQGRAIFLSFTNRAAIYYDRLIRDTLIDSKMHVVEGERLIANDAYVRDDNVLIANCAEVEVTDVNYGKSLYGIEYTDIQIKNLDADGLTVSTFLPVNEMDKRQKIDARYKRAAELNRFGKSREAESLISEARTLGALFSDLRPGHSMTVHRSQGMSINTVFMDLDNIGQMYDSQEMLKSLYVGTSRARKRVYTTGRLPGLIYS